MMIYWTELQNVTDLSAIWLKKFFSSIWINASCCNTLACNHLYIYVNMGDIQNVRLCTFYAVLCERNLHHEDDKEFVRIVFELSWVYKFDTNLTDWREDKSLRQTPAGKSSDKKVSDWAAT